MTEPVSRYTLITGASSGIGRAISIKLSEGSNLILHGRNVDELEATRTLCSAGKHLTWSCDFGNIDQVRPSLELLLHTYNVQIDSFIHCAGIVSISPTRTITLSATTEILSVNFVSAIEIVSSLLKKKNNSCLKNALFVSSIWSKFGARGYALYSASKGALDSAMRSMAVELAPRVRVNSLVLGAIETPMASAGFADSQILANLQSQYPLSTGKPDDAAEVAAFLISDSARWITGQQIVVDGGRTANMSLK